MKVKWKVTKTPSSREINEMALWCSMKILLTRPKLITPPWQRHSRICQIFNNSNRVVARFYAQWTQIKEEEKNFYVSVEKCSHKNLFSIESSLRMTYVEVTLCCDCVLTQCLWAKVDPTAYFLLPTDSKPPAKFSIHSRSKSNQPQIFRILAAMNFLSIQFPDQHHARVASHWEVRSQKQAEAKAKHSLAQGYWASINKKNNPRKLFFSLLRIFLLLARSRQTTFHPRRSHLSSLPEPYDIVTR